MIRRVLVAAGIAGVCAVTVVVFRLFDRHSHSASDTLRPVLLTMVPLWFVAVAAARAVLRRG